MFLKRYTVLGKFFEHPTNVMCLLADIIDLILNSSVVFKVSFNDLKSIITYCLLWLIFAECCHKSIVWPCARPA